VTDRLLELAGAGPRSWPRIAWPLADFAAELERRALVDLPTERIPDVYLAWACAHGDPAAVAAFEERFGADLAHYAAQVRLPPDLVDDVVQDVRLALLVARDGEPARIGQFAGRGDLRGWLRVIIARHAILASKRLRARRELPDNEPLEALAVPALDLEGELTRARCHDEFRAAFAEALATLAPRERALLRYRYLDGLTEDEVAALYDVHRVTIARWVARALARVLHETRRGLTLRLTTHTEDVASILRVLRHRLPLTLRRVLGGEPV
jgi:RNA polymerase sigma-70 factor (ECF subfamily)